MNPRRCLFAGYILLAMSIASTQPGWSQEARGTINGRVTDKTDAVIPGVAVHLTHVATNTTRDTETNETGNYVAPLLPEGTYRITAERQGFKTSVREGIVLRIDDNVMVNITMEVGAVSENITVTTEAPLLETSSASLGTVQDSKSVADLPTSFGTPFFLYKLGAAVNFTGGGQSQDQPWEPGATVNYNTAGSGAESSGITMDGADNSVRDQSGRATIPNYVPPSDAVAEFNVETVSFDAASAATAGGVMNISLKSGTNQLHGSFYFQDAPEVWSANQFFSNLNGIPRAADRTRRWGGSANGPVWLPKIYNGKNKTFFMFAYEDIHYQSPRGSNFTVPTAAERGGDFSALGALGSNYTIYNPFSRVAVANGRYQETPFPNNILPASMISPIATALLNPVNYPLPLNSGTTADGANNLPEPSAPQTVYFYTVTTRVDHIFTDKTRIFARYNRYKADFDDPSFFGPQSVYSGTDFYYHMDGAAFDYLHTFNATTVLDIKLSDSRYVRSQDSNPKGILNLATAYGFPEYYADLPWIVSRTPTVNLSTFSGFSGASYTLLWQPQENRALSAVLNKFKGSHGLKFGFDYRKYIENQYGPPAGAEGGVFTFDSTYTQGPLDNSPAPPRGGDLAAMLLGVPTSGNATIYDSYAESSGLFAGYIQDNWKVTRNLTVNWGLRYEVEQPLTERYNRSVESFNPLATHPAGNALVASGGNFDALAVAAYAQNPISQVPASQWSTLGGLTYEGVNGNPRYLFKPDWGEIMPRLGAAYRLGQHTVLRGGYGMFYGALGQRRGDVITTNFQQNTNLVPTNNNGLTFVASLANPYPTGLLPELKGTQGADTYLGQSLPTAFNRGLTAQREQHWQADIEHQFFGGIVVELGYIGSHGSDLQTTRPLDYIPQQYLSTLATRDQTTINYWTGTVPNPFAGLLPGTNDNGTVIARSALVALFPQFTGGSVQTAEGFNWYNAGYVTVNRRFSKGVMVQFSYTHMSQMDDISFLNAGDKMPEKVVSANDYPNHIGLSSIYELPFGQGKMLLGNAGNVTNKIVGGWQLSGTWTFQTGAPLGFGDAIFFGGDLKQVLDLPADQKYWKHWFDTSEFQTNPSLQRADDIRVLSSRFSWFRAPRQDYMNFSLFKNMRFKEKYNAQVRFEALNFLNHPWFGSPNTTASSTSFGQITTENENPRTVQFMLKFIF